MAGRDDLDRRRLAHHPDGEQVVFWLRLIEGNNEEKYAIKILLSHYFDYPAVSVARLWHDYSGPLDRGELRSLKLVATDKEFRQLLYRVIKQTPPWPNKQPPFFSNPVVPQVKRRTGQRIEIDGKLFEIAEFPDPYAERPIWEATDWCSVFSIDPRDQSWIRVLPEEWSFLNWCQQVYSAVVQTVPEAMPYAGPGKRWLVSHATYETSSFAQARVIDAWLENYQPDVFGQRESAKETRLEN